HRPGKQDSRNESDYFDKGIKQILHVEMDADQVQQPYKPYRNQNDRKHKFCTIFRIVLFHDDK
ncbi:MAG TPA: hypothetical protein PK540_12245, partial [Prolixibacteraceae bacterium]|nr:hypothetical protein [Prolixibacteraceae bacterium]HQL19965.1 hypothetical protein [Prolixibacteraceae bacterium]